MNHIVFRQLSDKNTLNGLSRERKNTSGCSQQRRDADNITYVQGHYFRTVQIIMRFRTSRLYRRRSVLRRNHRQLV